MDHFRPKRTIEIETRIKEYQQPIWIIFELIDYLLFCGCVSDTFKDQLIK